MASLALAALRAAAPLAALAPSFLLAAAIAAALLVAAPRCCRRERRAVHEAELEAAEPEAARAAASASRRQRHINHELELLANGERAARRGAAANESFAGRVRVFAITADSCTLAFNLRDALQRDDAPTASPFAGGVLLVDVIFPPAGRLWHRQGVYRASRSFMLGPALLALRLSIQPVRIPAQL